VTPGPGAGVVRTCPHGAAHPRRRPRADDPAVCERCPRCRADLAALGLPGVFRLAHLLVLRAADRCGADVAVPEEDVEWSFVTELDRIGAGDDGRAAWRDAGWLLRDLDDWGLVELRRRGTDPQLNSVSLTLRGTTVLATLSGR
jgi:hypothetical protein